MRYKRPHKNEEHAVLYNKKCIIYTASHPRTPVPCFQVLVSRSVLLLQQLRDRLFLDVARTLVNAANQTISVELLHWKFARITNAT
jgi:hypothetical protein